MPHLAVDVGPRPRSLCEFLDEMKWLVEIGPVAVDEGLNGQGVAPSVRESPAGVFELAVARLAEAGGTPVDTLHDASVWRVAIEVMAETVLSERKDELQLHAKGKRKTHDDEK